MNAQSSSFAASPPYALVSTVFRFRALASLAGRSPLGGPREVTLATYLVARLVDDCRPEKALPSTAREERAAGARAWLANVALPAAVRAALSRLAAATAGEPSAIAAALTSVISAVDAYLDAPSRSELARLERAFTK